MPQNMVVIIAGPPATGKTTLGRHLGTALALPFLHKDAIKEHLFDQLGWSDRAWSRTLGMASYRLLYHFVEVLLSVNQSLVVESNFQHQFDTPRFLDLQARYGFVPFQIQCTTEGQVLWQRFQQRAESGDRHPGHDDQNNYQELQPHLAPGRYPPLEIGGHLHWVDTTNVAAIDYAALLAAIRAVQASLITNGAPHE